MTKCIACFGIGFLSCGFMISAINTPIYELKRQADSMVKQCEQTLPRNQHCELVAVPVDKVGE